MGLSRMYVDTDHLLTSWPEVYPPESLADASNAMEGDLLRETIHSCSAAAVSR